LLTTSKDASAAGRLLADQMRLLTASDVNWDFYFVDDSKSVPDLLQKGGEEMAETKTKGAVEGGMDAIKEKIGLGGRDDDEDEERSGSRSRSRSGNNQ